MFGVVLLVFLYNPNSPKLTTNITKVPACFKTTLEDNSIEALRAPANLRLDCLQGSTSRPGLKCAIYSDFLPGKRVMASLDPRGVRAMIE